MNVAAKRRNQQGERSSMQEYTRIGIDLGKNYFQVHALPSRGGAPLNRKLKRSKFLEFFKQIEPCEIGMEACGSAHYWARELERLGHTVSLMPPVYTKPYVKRGKNDAVDAAACCEAMSRPDMRFVPVKTAEQQATLALHKSRELLIKQRNMSINALRGHLAEFGLVAAKGAGHIRQLTVLAEDDATLPEAIKEVVRIMARQIEALGKEVEGLERKIAQVGKKNALCALLDKIPGIGPLIASAIMAFVPRRASV